MLHDDLLDLSFNEVEVTLRKAVIGKGWPQGLAEEAGRAAVWLCAMGQDGVGAVLHALNAAVQPCPNHRAFLFPEAPALALGPTVADLLLTGAESVQVTQTDSPLLLLGMLGLAAEETRGFLWEAGGKVEGEESGVVQADGLTGPLVTAPCGLTLRPIPGMSIRSVQNRRIAVSTSLWKDACALAIESYVPASAESRAHAGAGDVDND